MAAPFGDTAVPAKYQAAVLAASVRYGVPPSFLAAQISAESGFNPNAVSPDGAIGIAQFLPSTAHSVGLDPHDPIASINAMAKLMAYYKGKFGSWEKALYAYHDGPGNVNTPGPAGQSYAREILGKAGQALTGAGSGDTPDPGVGVAPVGVSLDPFKPLETLLDRFKDPERWKRFGLYLGGTLLVVGGGVMLVGKDALGSVNDVATAVGKVK